MRRYHRKEWQAFRTSIIERDGSACVRCRRGPAAGASLQVHHKSYLPGRLPWDYPDAFCETLCMGCHAEEHGILRPFVGWKIGGYDDLGDLIGECELCGTSLRYVFIVTHPKWPSLEVGEVCCNHLTTTKLAGAHMAALRTSEAKRQRFVASKRWEVLQDGSAAIVQRQIRILIQSDEGGYYLRIGGVQGRRRFASIVEAKNLVFDQIETGQLQDFLAKYATQARSAAAHFTGSIVRWGIP